MQESLHPEKQHPCLSVQQRRRNARKTEEEKQKEEDRFRK